MKSISRRKMVQISGLTTVGSLIGVPAFSETMVKRKLSVRKLKIIVAGAHPGDPECGCGGTMALFASEGHEVVSVYLTRGGAGIKGKTYEEAAQIRTNEALKSSKILNSRAVFLEQIDGSSEITQNRYEEMNDFIRRENPDIVFTHWPIDSHRDHRTCSNLVYDAWINLGKKFLLYFYEVTSGAETQNFSPGNYINISSVINQKSDSCMAHISQEPEGWYVNIQRTIEKFRGIEFNCEYAEAFVRHNQNAESIVPR